MGTASGWLPLREGNAITQRHISQILDTLMGTDPGRPITLKRSDAALNLLTVSDSGVAVSPDGILPASNFFILPKMAVYWNGLAANVPPNFSILAAAKDRFVWNANVDGDVGDTGGANDHTHTGPSHTHTSASHTHDLSAHTHSSASHSHDLSAHTHDYQIDHDHPSATSGSNSTSENVISAVSGSGVDSTSHVDVADDGHTHSVNLPSLTDGKTSDGPDPDSTSSDQPGDTGGPDPDLTSSDQPGDTGASGTGATSGSSQTPPVAYWRGYLIERQ